MTVTLHRAPPVAMHFPDAWFDPKDRPGLDGHRHEYLFRTLCCKICKLPAVPYQYTNIPGTALPPRPLGRAIQPIYRADKVMRWLDVQIAVTNRRLFTSEMFSEYGDVIDDPSQVGWDTDGVWLGVRW